MKIIVQSTLPVVASRLSRLYRRLNGDLSPVMRAVGFVLENSTRRRIRTEKTAPDGAKWASLAPATIAARARKKTLKGDILVDSGLMLGGMTHETGRTWAIIGTNMPYAAFHQTGTKNMPARPIFGLSAKDTADIQDSVAVVLRGWFDE
ncbi:MAG: phage virion morphogenesis protein [Neisseriaceae bacterium]|nr:phage virion morphogenesis protein [Neisseriaceae bacterium]MBQ9683828.1 phage virion morphogenesis protein [Neisseriaceae bacterium]MBQ9725420.1 phage virion morphogenesis protein [Neisseriaceae bacterium]